MLYKGKTNLLRSDFVKALIQDQNRRTSQIDEADSEGSQFSTVLHQSLAEVSREIGQDMKARLAASISIERNDDVLLLGKKP